MKRQATSLGMTILAIETSCDETAVAILRRLNRESGSDHSSFVILWGYFFASFFTAVSWA